MKAHWFGIDIASIGKYNCVGELGVIDEGPRSGSVSSIGGTVLLKVSRDDFYRVAENDLKLGYWKSSHAITVLFPLPSFEPISGSKPG